MAQLVSELAEVSLDSIELLAIRTGKGTYLSEIVEARAKNESRISVHVVKIYQDRRGMHGERTLGSHAK